MKLLKEKQKKPQNGDFCAGANPTWSDLSTLVQRF